MTTVVQIQSEESIELRLKEFSEQKFEEKEETPLSKTEQAAAKAWEPRVHGKCGRKMWCYYFCNVDEKLGSDAQSSCCDADHLSMHIFFLCFAGSFIVLIAGLNAGKDNNGNLPSLVYYMFGMGWGLGVCVWGFWQFGRILSRRMEAAKIMDANIKLKRERGNLENNIRNAVDKRSKLVATHNTTAKTTEALKQQFKKLKKWTDESKIISDQNSKVGALLNVKLMKMLEDIQAELIASEKEVVVTIYEQMHFKDGEKGLDRKEFGEFIKKLPEPYIKKFKFEVGAFDEYAEDGVFDRNELFLFLDKIAEEEVTKI